MTRFATLLVVLTVVTLALVPQRAGHIYAAICPGGAAIIVNITADTVAVLPGVGPQDAGGNISLRSAIMHANLRPGPDTICLSNATYTLSLGPSDPDGLNGLDDASGDLDIFGDSLTILGVSAATTIVQAGTQKASSLVTGNGVDRVFHIDGQTVSMTDFTIRHGKANLTPNQAAGGGIFINGASTPGVLNLTGMSISDNLSNIGGGGIANLASTVNLQGTTVANNVASSGGGIHSFGGVQQPEPALNIGGSTISGNTTGAFIPPNGLGGGISATRGTVTISASTINGNSSATNGGGIFVTNTGQGAPTTRLTVTTSTISGSTSFGSGGGVFSNSIVTLTNSTVSGNILTNPTLGGGNLYSGGVSSSLALNNTTVADGRSTGTGGQIAFGAAALSFLSINNTIIAQGGSGTPGNCFQVNAVSSLGGNVSSDGTCTLTNPSDKLNSNPQLQALANNGGPTMTHMLGAGSTALDGGANSTCQTTDQRGLPRPTDGNGDGNAVCDSGAVEVAAVVSTVPGVSKAFNPATISSGGTSVLTLTFTNPNATQLTNVSISDALPAGMTVAATPNVTQTCGGATTVNAAAGSSLITMAGGVLAANASCTLSVTITATGTGVLTNTTGPVSSQQSGAGGTATAQLTVGAALPGVSTPTPVPTATPIATPTPVVLPVIPQQMQRPAAILAVQGGIGNGTRNNTPVPSRPALASGAGGAPAVMPVITPPSTGDAGLRAFDD